MSLTKFFRSIHDFSKEERLFVLFSMLAGFCITGEYSITKPVSYSVFISTFTTSVFPYAWLLNVPFNFFLIWVYNRLIPSFGPLKMVMTTVILTIVINLISSVYITKWPVLCFFHFLWKDLYVLLMFQHLWSVIHATIPVSKAKYLYGILYSFGGLGSACGSLFPGFLALKTGSSSLLVMTAFFYIAFVLIFRKILQYRERMVEKGASLESIKIAKENPQGGIELIRKSRYLTFILLIVIFMQLAASLIDFQFNGFLEKKIVNTDLRTEYYGRLFSVIHFVNIFFQLFGTYFVIKLLGLRKSHFLVPCIFLLSISSFLVLPIFPLLVFGYATVKSFDYSLFSIIKEMLYIPLGVEAKFKAKPFIDVFAYRSSKAFASCIIFAMQLLHIQNISSILSYVLVGIFALWIGFVIFMFKEPTRSISTPIKI